MNRNEKKRLRFCVFPGYNWCGPGCSGPDAPINAVDAACKVHDECYRGTGNRCRCDREFLRQLEQHMDLNTQEGHHARVIHKYMKVHSFFNCKFL
ncbi:phospholipase [Sporosarcina siberiensis]|uniref:Phospholipase n=1 Tax=Sporosarcina siberiensis TaxID=1365606 RepID=A0ABW4SI31_9BACL